ncbi:RHS repeat-associated core domain-containing protein [Streptomyces sp. CA-111067]|uniref:RHS repeat-associated core domain-containing protein n=1 Tax=Streptomyces sp. CA-111067 TaxID=3240046 RepID=UPI003D97AF66
MPAAHGLGAVGWGFFVSSGSGNRWMRSRLLRGVLLPVRSSGGSVLGSGGARLVVLGLAVALTVPLGLTPIAHQALADAPKPLGRTAVPKPRVSKVRPAGLGAKAARDEVAKAKAADDQRAVRAAAEQHATWPKGGAAQIPQTATSASGKAVVGGLPVTIGRSPAAKAKGNSATDFPAATAGPAQVTVADRSATKAAGVQGVLLSVRPQATGPATVSVDYSAFASAYGGDWAGRLQLVSLPACALTTPDKVACRVQTPLPSSRNDVPAQTVSATAQLEAGTSAAKVSVFGVEAKGGGESASGTGNYSATALSSSAKWAEGGASGSFTWSYPMQVPPTAAGPSPSVGLSYDSGSIDGRTASTNNQGSPVGEGFSDSAESYITRQYGSCDLDGHDKVYDECWKYDNASLVLNGKSTELVKDDTTGTWRLADDDASTVTHLTGADNGDQGDPGKDLDGAGEYWTVTTGNGTQYVFGLNKLPGADAQRTNSVWTVPVFGDDDKEPGYQDGTTFAGRSLNQAWRWNLDYVVDLHGNAMSYWYTAETNYYKKNGATTANAQYTRGGHLDKILYGQQQQSDSLFVSPASQQVTFGYSERCTADDCSSLTSTTAASWPDVPFDAICASGASDTDCTAESPAFFTRKRLTQVETSVLSGTGYTPVDTWVMTQHFFDPGTINNTSDQSLVLDTITHTGDTGTPRVPLKPVTFTYTPLANRVDLVGDNVLPLKRPRIETIVSETGAITHVTMSDPECVSGSHMPVAEDRDTMSCYPVYWHINGAETAGLDWFQKYRVIGIRTSDPTGGTLALDQSYSYADPAWHYDDSPFTPEDERTWSQWRGYGTVTAITGNNDNNHTKTVTRYMQGMSGDKVITGGLEPIGVEGLDVPGLPVATITDSDQYAGFAREQVTYNGATAVSASISDPWSAKTATQHKSYADIEAYYVRTGKTYTETFLTAKGTWRTATTATTYDAYGLPVKVDSAGDTAKTGDETCTRTWYARNDALGINSLTSRVRTVGRTCATTDASLSLPATFATRGDVLSDTATLYDTTATTWTPSQSATHGEATWTGRATGYPATADANGDRNPSGWQATTQAATYDDLGRLLRVEDADGNATATAYTPAGAGPTTRTIVTNSKSQRVITNFDGVRGLPSYGYDVNNAKTELTYDALGRLTGVWLPNRSKTSNQSANTTYTYHLDNATASYVATSTLGISEARNTSYQIYDSLLRPLQTQTPTPVGGRVLTDTRYDTRGLVFQTYAGAFDSESMPNGTYMHVENGGTPTEHELTYDGAGRPTSDTLYVVGVKKGSTTFTTYTGDSTATSAQAGGSATRTITDALGRTTELRSYAGTSPADADYGGTTPLPTYTTTGYTSTRDGLPATVTGPDSAKWTYGYDLFGRQISATDPDMGTTTTTYTDLDQVATTHTSVGNTVGHTYDSLGRKTNLWQTSNTAANQLAAWTYDTVATGQPASSTRYVGGSGTGGKAYTKKVTAYDKLYHPIGSEIDLDPTDPLVTSKAAAASYTFTSNYNTDGSLHDDDQPAIAGLPAENVTYGYLPTGQVNTASSYDDYLLDAVYSPLGQPKQLNLGASVATIAKQVYLDNEYEEGTGRLTRSFVTDDTHAWMPQDLHYTYDDAGDVTKISDPATQGATAKPDTQCFTYDGYQRLTSAWTPANADCASTTTGGAAPYSTSYTYNPAGLRLTQTQHATGGNTTTLSCYTKTTQPHTLTATTTGSTCTGVSAGYTYDSTGNTTTRPQGGSPQTLTWNTEGKLSTTAQGTNTAGYLYDADGNLLIRRATDATGESVIYLGGTELHIKTASGKYTTWATRTYTAGPGGPAIAVRTSQPSTPPLTFIAGDAHGTSSLALDASTLAITKRYTSPFGAPRSTATAWPDDKTFLGAPTDTDTGLTHIGAREYDPQTGRFLSVDPLLTTSDPQSLNGYTYADNNPATFSDPTGTMRAPVDRGVSCEHADCSSATSGTGNVPTSGADASQDWIDQESLSTDDSSLGESIYPFMRNQGGHPEGGYWNPFTNVTGKMETVCFGRTACNVAWKYLLRHPDDVAEGRYLAATYCLDNMRQCQSDAADWDHTQELTDVILTGLMADRPSEGKPKISGCSFTPDTPVLMAEAKTKPIGEIKPGDKVEAASPNTGQHKGVRSVTATHINHDNDLVDLSVETSPGHRSTLHTTSRHPFWDDTLHKWIPAGQLKPAHSLETATDHHVRVSAVHIRPGAADMWNLTVDELHTYYVLAGTTPVLVHNSSCWTATNSKTPMQNALGHWGKHKGDYPQLQNAKQYVEAAQRFMKSEDPWIQTKVRSNGDIVRYNRVTEDFGIMTPNGEIRTYYKPDPMVHGYASNQDYFDAQ